MREICNSLINQACKYVSGEQIFSLIEAEDAQQAVDQLKTTLQVCGKDCRRSLETCSNQKKKKKKKEKRKKRKKKKRKKEKGKEKEKITRVFARSFAS